MIILTCSSQCLFHIPVSPITIPLYLHHITYIISTQ